MRLILAGLCTCVLIACASKTRRSYPDNASFEFYDLTAGNPGGNLDSTGVTMHYQGPITDTIEDVGLVEAKVTAKTGGRAAVLTELQKEALKLKAEGIYQVEVKQDGDKWTADGYAFRYRQR